MRLLPLSLYKVSGHSMEPTLKEGYIVLVSNWSKNFKVRDIVVAESKRILIKRIKFIEGASVFLEGDNKKDSLDSRKLGAFKRNEILGKVIKVF